MVARSAYNGLGNGFEGDFFGLLLGGFEFTIDSHVGIIIEVGVGFHARFRLGAAFEDRIIMVEETYAPLEGIEGMIMFESVRSALGLFDEITVRHTSSRPRLWEMIGVELQETASATWDTTDDDVFLVMETSFVGIHGSIEHGV